MSSQVLNPFELLSLAVGETGQILLDREVGIGEGGVMHLDDAVLESTDVMGELLHLCL